MGLYLTAAATNHLNASITNPGITLPLTHVYNAQNHVFLNSLAGGDYNCWGCTKSRLNTFGMLNVNDEVLLSENGSKTINFHGIILDKLPYPDNLLSNNIWNSEHENIFLIGNIRKLNISKELFIKDLYGNSDTITSPRYIGPANNSIAWTRYNAIKGRYGI